MDFSAGIFVNNQLQNDDVLYYGVSVPQLLTSNFGSSADNALTQRQRHYYLLLGFYHFFGQESNADFRTFVEPSIWLRYVPNVPMQMDANVRLNIQQFWVGGGLAMSVSKPFKFDIMHVESGIRVKTGGDHDILKIGLGYDITTNNASQRLGTTYEINIVYSLSKGSN